MPSDREMWKKINALGVEYGKHLFSTSSLSYTNEKIDNLLVIQTCGNTSKLSALLDEEIKTDIPGVKTRSELLQINRTNKYVWFFQVFLIAITFPLSLPILIIWSLVMRDTPNFFKTTGAIYVENILRYKDQFTYTEGPRMQLKDSSYKLGSTEVDSAGSLAQQSEGHINQINAGISSLFSVLLSEDMIGDKLIKNETGNPIITSYRINDVEDTDSNTFSMDIKCLFRWTGHRKEKARLVFANNFKPLANEQEYQRPILTPREEVREGVLVSIYSSFFPRPGFTEVFEAAKKMPGVDSKRRAKYLEAYDLANTEVQRIEVLESFINTLFAYHDHLANYWAQIWPTDGSEAEMVLEEINKSLTWLPNDYQTMTPSANRIRENYDSIFRLLQEKRIDEAWAMYDPNAQLSYFIKRAFPNINAMRYQLQIIFRISRHEDYYPTLAPVEKCHRVWIPEIVVIDEIRCLFLEIRDIFETYNLEQLELIRQNIMEPINVLIDIGKKAAEDTPYQERVLRREIGIKRNRSIWFNQGVQHTHRVDEDMDVEEEPRVVSLDDLNNIPDPDYENHNGGSSHKF